MNPAKSNVKAAIITPPGEGGIGIIVVTGPGATDVLGACFQGTRRAAHEIPTGAIAHGRIMHRGQTLDEVIVARLDAASSYTGELLYEVNCHGGAVAVQSVLHRLNEAGADVVRWEALVPRPVGEPPLSPLSIRAEALARLPRAHTRTGARMLLHQAHGALSKRLAAIRSDLSGGSADDSSLKRLCETAPLGHALLDPHSVMLAGPPNVGKSSLLNALLRRERVIVHEQPGTTRDVVRETISIRGVPFELTDCAGLRPGADGIEEEAVRRAAELLWRCDVVLLMYDVRTGLENALSSLPSLPLRARAIFVGNKIDLLAGAPPAASPPGGAPCLLISARDGRNLADVQRALFEPYQAAVSECEAGGAVVFTDAIRQALNRVLEALSRDGASQAVAELAALGVA